MSKFYIYLSVPNYLKQFLENAFGNPVVLPNGTPSRDIIEFLIRKKSEVDVPEAREGNNLVIEIPPLKGKDPQYWNYMPDKAKSCLVNHFQKMFSVSLWEGLSNMENVLSTTTLTDIIYLWLEKNGISEDSWEMVRQRYLRYRNRYKKKGIQL